MEPILQINNLSRKYESFRLNNISLTLEEGFIMGLVGPNGAGKTTLIKLILNMIRKDSGSIKIFGEDVLNNENGIKQKIGFVLDEPGWYEVFRISEMVKIISPFYTRWNQKLFDDYLARFQIDSRHKIENLSKGMKMKFSLAVALSHDAQFIIMDEPTSGLDPIVRAELLEILQQLIREENKSILFSSHISSDIEKISDYITFLNEGNIVFSESRESISDRFTLVKGPLELLDRDILSCFDSVQKKNSHFTALCTRTEELKERFGSFINCGKVLIERATIDEIMLHTIKGDVDVYSGL
ncbi:MAG: ABC transporter ATP-binding protein [Spirochaetales bacterium]|nr:ABC transporter ATP-binding protein [Spirochaetales bacterium]